MSMDNSVLLTIIVPIYNVEKFLKECLDSFTDQSDKNFDVILVNDGSTDGSENIMYLDFAAFSPVFLAPPKPLFSCLMYVKRFG